MQDGHHHNHHSTPNMKSDAELPIDPSIAASSPTQYPGPYSPYPPPGHEMAQYQGHPPPQGYGQWPPHGYGHPHGMPGGPYSSPGTAVSAGGQAATAGPRPGQVSSCSVISGHTAIVLMQHSYPLQVYSFVPIPGAQQHKRPRRRYEEIERMYKCGWNGCEKAYGTLNHLNAHVTMQSHGTKRTPEGQSSQRACSNNASFPVKSALRTMLCSLKLLKSCNLRHCRGLIKCMQHVGDQRRLSRVDAITIASLPVRALTFSC